MSRADLAYHPIPHPRRQCSHCATFFAPSRPWQRFCSTHCRLTHWDQRHPRRFPDGSLRFYNRKKGTQP